MTSDRKSGTLIKKQTNQSLKNCFWIPGMTVNFEEIQGTVTVLQRPIKTLES